MKFLLSKLTLENFKTYAGKVELSALKPFNAIVGPNGSGKSNLVDAISFVFGEQISELRVRNAQDLIHGASFGNETCDRASVTAVFESLEDPNDQRQFTRIVKRNSQDYLFNLEIVPRARYLEELEKLGINMKGKHTVVYQGRVESITEMDPKQRTNFFEEISGSKALKKKYDDLKKAMTKANDSTCLAVEKKRTHNDELREAKLEKNEAGKYDDLKEDLTRQQVELQVFELFINQKEIENREKEKNTLLQQLEEMQLSKDKLEENLKQVSKTSCLSDQQLSKLQKKLNQLELQKDHLLKNPEYVKAEETVPFEERKKKAAELSLKKALELRENCSKNLKLLNKELESVDSKLSKLNEEFKSQGKDIELEGSQVEEYRETKKRAEKDKAPVLLKLEHLRREQKAHLDQLENERRKVSDVEVRMSLKRKEKDDALGRNDRLAQSLRSLEEELNVLCLKKKTLETDVLASKEQINSIQADLEIVSTQLNDLKEKKIDNKTREQKIQAVQILGKRFPGVYSRLTHVCKPIHAKYAVSLIKVMGKNLQAIVVDTAETARGCIKYLKENRMAPETFLPLDSIMVKPLKEWLRSKVAKNVHFLFDVVECKIPEVKEAVIFATESVLVCESADEAEEVAYNTLPNKILDVVSLDGTFFKKSGIISGGCADIAKRAKDWNEEDTREKISALQDEKETLTERLRNALKISRQEQFLTEMQHQVKGLEARIRMLKLDLGKSEANVKSVQTELAHLENVLQERKRNIQKLEINEPHLDEREAFEAKLNTIEDKVFARFCAKIGVSNIRVYEVEGLRYFEDLECQQMDLLQQKNRIESQIEYEKNSYGKDNQTRWEKELKRSEEALKCAKSIIKKSTEELKKVEDVLEPLTEEFSVKKIEADTLKKQMEEVQKNVKQNCNNIKKSEKEVLLLESKISQLYQIRRSLLLTCEVENIPIPFLNGSLGEVLASSREQAESRSDTDFSSSSSNTAPRITELDLDYDILPRKLLQCKNKKDIDEYKTKLTASIAAIKLQLDNIKAPNMKVQDKLESVKNKLIEANAELAQISEGGRRARDKFEKVKAERFNRFMDCFDFVSTEIDGIYKLLTNSSAMALLTLEDPEEPYLSGTSFCCIAPGKACKPMSSLSGGEKTVASIALLLAVLKYSSTPCIVLDEIDAALDNSNIAKVVSYFSNNKEDFQTIAISHREKFFCRADTLVGVVAEAGRNPKSEVFLYNLAAHKK